MSACNATHTDAFFLCVPQCSFSMASGAKPLSYLIGLLLDTHLVRIYVLPFTFYRLINFHNGFLYSRRYFDKLLSNHPCLHFLSTLRPLCELLIRSSHPHIPTSPHHHIPTSPHPHIPSSSHPHIPTSPHHHIPTSSHHHIRHN